MKISLLVLALGVTSTPVASEPTQEFLSWYNGWTVHTVWGIGQVSGSYLGATIKCGGTLVPIRAVYDTHADRDPPKPEQVESYVKAVNLALLGSIEAIAGKCEFWLSANEA